MSARSAFDHFTENALFCATTKMQCWIVLCRCAPIRYYLSRAELLFRTSGPRGRERSSQVECGHLGHFLLRGVKNFLEAVKVAQIFECTVQLVVGLGSTHLPLRAERIWIGQQIVFSPFGFTRRRSTQISKCMKHLACDDKFAAQEGVFEPDVCR